MSRPLSGRVAVVAGATRGAGRGIAVALGEAGATVYCSGRSVRGAPATPGRPETVEETAEQVTAAGGRGVAVRCDHLEEDQVRSLFARVEREAGRLDVLVNDIWGGDPLVEWGKPFWEMDMERGLRMLRTGLDTHLLTARHGIPLLLARPGGLVVEVTDGNGWYYRGSLFYDLVKTTVLRLAFALHEELRAKGATALAVTPGFLRSEAVLDHFGVTEETWREAVARDPNFAESETPRFVGRAVAALAADPQVARRGGRVWASWDLAEAYGFADADGRRPHWGRHIAAKFPGAFPEADGAFYAYGGSLEAMRRAMNG